jgi:hypothetical protein
MRIYRGLLLCFLALIGGCYAADMMVGLNAAWQDPTYLADAQALHVQWIRVENWNGEVSTDAGGTVAAALTTLATAGIKVLPLVNNYYTSWVTAEGQTDWINNVTYYAKTYGKGGTFWSGKTDMGTDVIEVGNECYGSWYPWPDTGYLRPDSYAQMLKAAGQSVTTATAGRVKILASVAADYQRADGTWHDWGTDMKAAVPNITSYIGGIVVHPYGDIASIGVGTSTDPNWYPCPTLLFHSLLFALLSL